MRSRTLSASLPAGAALELSGCGHCGLPAPAGERFCCYGCELAAEVSHEESQSHSQLRAILTFCLLLSMGVMMLSLFLFAEDVYGATEDPTMAKLRGVYRVAAAIFATPVILLCGVPLLRRALSALARGKLTMEVLVGTGAVAAYGLSLVAMARGEGGVYFDSATSALMLSTFGRYLEGSARARASGLLGRSLELSSHSVKVLDPRTGEHAELPPAAIARGDRLRVDAGQAVPVDAELVAPVEVDLGVLTGESAPRLLQAGARVPGGAVPVSGALEGIALGTARESALERLAELARKLRERPSSAQRLADRFAAALVPAVWLLALGSFAAWAAHGPVDRAVEVGLAVVLAACPCTYGIATPLSLWLALRKALEHGALIRSASGLEALARVDEVGFDKTGTLTGRELEVREVRLAPGVREPEVRARVAALEDATVHPVARALVRWACGAAPAALRLRRLIPGRGAVASDAEGRRMALGSLALMQELGVAIEAPEGARAFLACDSAELARFTIGEALRPEARAAVEALRRDGISSVILTGDGSEGARAVGESLGIPSRSELTAEAKVQHLRERGERVAMVGDGLNDGPALAWAGPGFAMGGGSDLARGMAQVSLLREDLRLVPWTLALARKTVRHVRVSLISSTAYNLVFLGLAVAGALRPVWAGLSMITASLLTLALSQQLTAVRGPEEEQP